ncbi:hypothetical protein U5640_36245 [Streptomyces sp. SS7]|uniref:hypothetical protein n=1 Tax=Streptomyces sp. SS7 TaxID=3108485 RepID=UPI0030EE0636
MAERWRPAAELFGLHVDSGRYRYDRLHDRLHWTRLPVATFTCRCGYEHKAVGAADVAYLTSHLDEFHARSCPGPNRKDPTA